MNELFTQLLGRYGFSAEEVGKYAADFSGILFLGILGAAEYRLTEEDKDKISGFLSTNDYASVLTLVRAKYSDDDWNTMLEEKAAPFIDGYVREVIPA